MSVNQARFPERSKRFGIGKQIGGAVYVHRQYESKLPQAVAEAKSKIPGTFGYVVVKYVTSDETVSFIDSIDFDVSDEPAVGDVYTVKLDGRAQFRQANKDPWIYHHKWLFVADDYEGFDVEASIERSRQWLALKEIDFRRIGKRSFWETQVVPRLGESTNEIREERQMEKVSEEQIEWVRSDDALKILRVTHCDLAHLRQAGEIAFRKQGNAFLYAAEDCRNLKSK